MQFRIPHGKTEVGRRQKATQSLCVWHRWFAWHPVRIGINEYAWLETVERKAARVIKGGAPWQLLEFNGVDFLYRVR